MTARQLATELEVSERTICRDIDALTLAGIPIYAEVGQGGGYGLVDAYRTDLTGMTLDELRAILSLSIPAPSQDLGIADDLRSALRKLTAATACSSDSVSPIRSDGFIYHRQRQSLNHERSHPTPRRGRRYPSTRMLPISSA